MMDLFDSPLFGILLSLIAFESGLYIYRKTRLSILNPLFTSITLIIVFLLKFNIKLESYNKGGSFISFFLGPATIILAVPLYKKLDHLKRNMLPVIVGIFAGCITAVTGAVLLTKAFKLERPLSASLIPKSVTTPIGIEISKQIGGIPSVTVAAIILTGIMGAVLSPVICRLFRITNEVAAGIAIGTSSHAIGTSKAIELGETQGAMSGLAIGVAGFVTVFLAPIAAKFL